MRLMLVVVRVCSILYKILKCTVPNPILVSAARDSTVRQWALNTTEEDALQRTLFVPV